MPQVEKGQVRWARLATLLAITAAFLSCGRHKTHAPPAGDPVPPAAIMDVSATVTGLSTVTLRWTAPGGHGAIGTAASYDVRSGLLPLTLADWGFATPFAGTPTPSVAGTSEHFTLHGLTPGTTRFIVVRARDDAGNLGGFSNALSVRLAAPGVAFSAEQNALGVYELFGTDFSGGPCVNLSGPIVPGGAGVKEIKWSPDRSQVAFSAEKDTVGTPELYVVSALGGAPVKVSAGRIVTAFAWAPDGSRLAYRGFVGLEPDSLFCCDPDGTGNLQVSAPIAETGGVLGFSWAPDSSRLAYFGSYAPLNLFSVRPDGTGHAEVTGGLVFVLEYRWSPDGSHIAYRGSYGISASKADGTDYVQLSGPQYPGGAGIKPGTLEWAPDGSRVAYLANQNSYILELFTTLADGSANVRVPDPATGIMWVDQFSWAPDSSRLAYRGEVVGPPETEELYTALPDGSGNVNLSQTGAMYFIEHRWSPDSSRLAYTLNGELHTVLAGGGGISSVAPGKNIGEYRWAPDGSRLAYHVATITYDLFACLPDGTATAQLSGPLVAGGGQQMSFAWSSDSSKVLYQTDEITDGIHELFAAAPTGGSIKVSGLLVPGGQVLTFVPK